MHDELGTYNIQDVATVGMENAVSDLTRSHKVGSPLANIRNAFLLEPGIIVGEVFWATFFATKGRHFIVANTAAPDFVAAFDGTLAVLLLLALGVYSIARTHSGTGRRRIQRALLTGACAAIGTGVICYIEEGTFILGTSLLFFVSLALPLYSLNGMLQKRRTTRLLNQHLPQTYSQDLSIGR